MPTVFQAKKRVDSLNIEITGLSKEVISLREKIKDITLRKTMRIDDLYVAVKHWNEAKEKSKA